MVWAHLGIVVSSLFLPEQLSAIPEFADLGPLFKSSDKAVELTESETEYVVRCVKHTFSKHIVFQVSVHSHVIVMCSAGTLIQTLAVMSVSCLLLPCHSNHGYV